MKHKLLGASVSLLLLLVTFSGVAYAGGHGPGHTASQLEKAGWFCVNAGPHKWVHCFNPGMDPTSESLQVKVFTEDGSKYLGTELLLRADLYHGQPCPQDGGGEYDLLPAFPAGPFPVAYRACHHFDTSDA